MVALLTLTSGLQMRSLLCIVCVGWLTACGTLTSNNYFLSPGLTDDKTALVVTSMTAVNVAATLGQPYQRVRFNNLNATAWDYRYIDSWGYIIDFSVMIGDDGRVINKVSARGYADNH